MIEIDQTTRHRVILDNGVTIRTAGSISEAEVHDGVVVVVLQWLRGRPDARLREVWPDNVYGYDAQGRLLWRVGNEEVRRRPLYYTGFVEHGPSVTLHVASGWHATLDPRTGRLVHKDCVR
jgi:hypothetical protein